MKRLILVGGAMGVGKTSACRALQQRLERCVFLDGDWCWDMRPFVVNEETKRMVLENICFLLNQFLACSAYENVLFCWVMHRQEILDALLAKLNLAGVELWTFSLTAEPGALAERIQRDIARGVRESGALERSLDYLKGYGRLNTEKIDVSRIGAAQAAEQILTRMGVDA